VGDVHYYNYDADCWDVSTYPRTRFTSEYGFQSFPSFISLSGVSNGSAGDWEWNSPFTLHRQHHGSGNDQILNQMGYHFNVPNNTNATKKYILTLWMSQVMHGQCIKIETEHYRRIMTECNQQNSGCNMGTLYWQANDIWQGASWSSLEWGGRWKVLHYLAKQFYNPILASMYLLSGNGGIYVVNETPQPISGSLSLTMWSWDSLTPLNTWSQDFNQAAFSANPVYNFSQSSLLSSGKCPSVSACVLTYQIANPSGVVWSSNHYFLSSLKDVTTFKNPQLTISSVVETIPPPEYAHAFIISFSSQAIAPFVWLETTQSGHFSDNGFLWVPTSEKSVSFYTRAALTPASLQASLTIWSLWDTTH
jgi:beta-mannosidase